MGTYCGPSRLATVAELADLERRGWVAEVKEDGVYCEAYVGNGGRVALARYRTGVLVAPDCGRDLLGLRTPFAPGTVLVGELQVQTPASHRWQDRNGGVRGFVVFDLLAWGNTDAVLAQLGAGTLGRAPLPARDMTSAPNHERRAVLERLFEDVTGKAAALRLVARRKRGLRDWYEQIVMEGGEGVVLKDPGAPAGKGARKLKRRDMLTCRVVALVPGENVVRLDWGGRVFGVTAPRFPVAVGQLVDVAAVGYYESDMPRHGRIVRIRQDLAIT